MKYMTVGALVIGGLMFASGAVAGTVGKSIVQGTALWGFVDGPVSTKVHKLYDPETKTTCYVAYYGVTAAPDMECVK